MTTTNQLLIIKVLQVARNHLQSVYNTKAGSLSGTCVYQFACNTIKHSVAEITGTFYDAPDHQDIKDAALAYIQPYAPIDNNDDRRPEQRRPDGKLPLGDAWWRADMYGLRMRIAMLDLAIEDAINASVP